jgi:pimeloyl-ACP methyl ester carboxylesterase/DNA-binding CsgD family transcriptional regulator
MLRPSVGYASAPDGIAIAYGVVGDGPVPIVVVPPLIGQVEVAWEEPSFVHFVTRLAVGATVIVFDRRGSGLSDQADTDEELALPNLATDVVAVLDACAIDRAALFAASMGGLVALQVAADQPDRVSALALVGPSARVTAAPGYEGIPVDAVDDFVASWLERWGQGGSVEADASVVAGNERYREWAARIERHTGSPRSIERTIRAALSYDVRHLLGAIDVPTLVVHRAKDPVVPASQSEYVAAQLPVASYVELDGDTHTFFLGAQDEVLDAVRDFLDEHVAGGSLRAATRRARRSSTEGRGWESLTASEREVALLVGSGMTNAEAAERLAMSRFTVDGRLRRVYQKLHVSTRAELAAACAQVQHR